VPLREFCRDPSAANRSFFPRILRQPYQFQWGKLSPLSLAQRLLNVFPENWGSKPIGRVALSTHCTQGFATLADHRNARIHMLYWAAIFLVIAIVAAAFGFGGIAASAVGIAKILFVIFLVLFLVSAIAGLAGRRGPPPV
jgi:uncharacterized membrane protein YtjA (UPF0391 family)